MFFVIDMLTYQCRRHGSIDEQLPMKMLDIDGSTYIPTSEFTLSFSRSSGPGGQNVNKTSTRVELRFDVTKSNSLSESQRQIVVGRLRHRLSKTGVLIVASDRHRTQGQNRLDCERKLVESLQEALRPLPPKRRKTRPGLGARKRRLDSKKRQSDKKRNRRRPMI